MFDDRSFFESLRLEPYYLYTATQVPAGRDVPATSWSRDTRERRLTLVHGDYSPKNVLVHDDRLILLDHEVIHWGDPAFDVGFALTHLLSKAHHLPTHREAFARAAAAVLGDLLATRCRSGVLVEWTWRPMRSGIRSAACSRGWPGGRRWSISTRERKAAAARRCHS